MRVKKITPINILHGAFPQVSIQRLINWHDFHNNNNIKAMMKRKYNGQGSIKQDVLTLYISLNSNVI